MSDIEKLEEFRREAKARGAIEIDDSQPGQGFQDDATEQPLDAELAKQIDEFEQRCRERKPDTRTDEFTKQLQEENTDAVRKQRLPFQSELEQWHPGRILWMGEFLRLLQIIRPDAFLAEVSYLGLRGLGFMQNGVPTYSGVSVQNGNMAEWSQFRFDSHGVALSERKRGWRAVLLALIGNGIINVEQANAVFGEPENSPRSKPWHRKLFILRNGRCPECRKQLCACGDGYDHLRTDAYAYPVPSEIAKGKRQILERSDASALWMP